MIGWLLGAALAFVVFHKPDPSKGYPAGLGPLDRLPAGLGKPSGDWTPVHAPSTKIDYATWTWPPQGAQQFHVAARNDGKKGWVSYWVNRTTGARSFAGGWTPSDGDQLALLRQDFGV